MAEWTVGVAWTGGDFYIGDEMDEVLEGSAADDVIYTYDGSDIITGGLGADHIDAGLGADTFVYLSYADSTPTAYDTIDAFETGVDVIDLSALSIRQLSTVSYGDATFLFGETTTGERFQLGATGQVQLSDLKIGTGVETYMQGDAAANTLKGGAGTDALNGLDGDDTLVGGGGSDTLFGGEGRDAFVYTATSDSTLAAMDTILDFTTGVDTIDLTALRTGDADTFTVHGVGLASSLSVDLGGDGVDDLWINVAGSLSRSDVVWGSGTGISDVPSSQYDLLAGMNRILGTDALYFRQSFATGALIDSSGFPPSDIIS